MNNFPIGRYRLTFVLDRAVHSKEYLGVQFQRWIHQLLRQLVCFTKAPHCDGCVLHDRCTYPLSLVPFQRYLFSWPWQSDGLESGQAVIYWQDTVVLEFALIGEIKNQIALYVYVLEKLFATKLKYVGARGQLTNVEVYDYSQLSFQSIWEQETGTLLESFDKHFVLPPLESVTTVKIQFVTPLKVNSHVLNIYEFFRILVSRLKQCKQQYGYDFLEKDFLEKNWPLLEQIHFEQNLRRIEWKQFLHTQKKPVHFDGWMGEIQMTGTHLALFLPLLRLGEVLHIGRNTNLGLGKYVFK